MTHEDNGAACVLEPFLGETKADIRSMFGVESAKHLDGVAYGSLFVSFSPDPSEWDSFPWLHIWSVRDTGALLLKGRKQQ
jgi:hypothetical protein